MNSRSYRAFGHPIYLLTYLFNRQGFIILPELMELLNSSNPYVLVSQILRSQAGTFVLSLRTGVMK